MLKDRGRKGFTVSELFAKSERESLVELFQELLTLQKNNDRIVYDAKKCIWFYRKNIWELMRERLVIKK